MILSLLELNKKGSITNTNEQITNYGTNLLKTPQTEGDVTHWRLQRRVHKRRNNNENKNTD